ncbi:hypothetical protein HYQ45_000605 [Verticillium longisporum]|uniref:GEgh 16 protein n=1 Tax=Verticillium longisporum TaxID=100787 RepID=A0A8I3A227_VERLO|nr:hypothetical protein HYQ45_000605 [Verticillium longisporum]PNH43333.1 hypothetical protein VD0004_g4095 [Verticillium dahliae]PNH76199.1 hypothetical protein VD0001_g1411 [Verticillium dahliae]
MVSFTDFLSASAVLAIAHGHGVILNAQGPAGPGSVGFQVNPDLPRNCTTISPCQQDATLIRDAEIQQNLVNECGRTELAGNIDIGENTENALAANAVTQVTKGSSIEVTIHQVNADGAGPYVCDLDQTSNGLRLVGQIPLNVTNNVPGANGFSQAKAQQFKMTVTLPDDLACTGASTGNVCTVRCRNNAVAGPFGGCFPVQQTDIEPKVNTPANLASAQSLELTLAQTQNNQADLVKALEANANAGTDEAKQNLAAVEAILNINPTTKAAPVQTPDLPTAPAASSDTVTSAPAEATEGAGAGAGADNGIGNGNGNAGNGNNRGGNAGGNNNNNNGNGAGNGNGNGRGRNGGNANRNGGAGNAGNAGAVGGRFGNNNKRSIGLRWSNRMA